MEEFRRNYSEFIIRVPKEIKISEEEGFRGVNIGMCFTRHANMCSENKI